MKSKIFYFPLILLSLLYYCSNYLVFPIKIKKPKIEATNKLITAYEYIKYSQNNQISTSIYMGTPLKEVEIYLTMDQYDFLLGKGFCLSNPNSKYDPLTSTSYTKSGATMTSPLYNNGSISEDNCNFYTELDLSKNKSVNKIEFIYGIASTDFYDLLEPESNCGFLGLQLNSSSTYFEWSSFIYNLKFLNAINSKKWSLIFYEDNKKKNNYDGVFVLGIKENDFQTIFNVNNNSDDYASTYSLKYIYDNTKWEIKFDEIYYNQNNQNISFFSDIQGQLAVDYDYIISNKDYFNSIKTNFFDNYINEGICYIDQNETLKRKSKKDKRVFNIIICDKNKFKDMHKFPSLNFKHRDLNKIFEFTYKDLFQEIGNSLVFSIVMDEEDKYHWIFGRIFFKKYQFIFDVDQKTISYIKKNLTENNGKSDAQSGDGNSNTSKTIIRILQVLLIVALLLGIVIGLFFGKKLWDNKRKIRANELIDDDYDYSEKKENTDINGI
jgi:hypothetical protein